MNERKNILMRIASSGSALVIFGILCHHHHCNHCPVLFLLSCPLSLLSCNDDVMVLDRPETKISAGPSRVTRHGPGPAELNEMVQYSNKLYSKLKLRENKTIKKTTIEQKGLKIMFFLWN
jgi:hypothetical protein